MSVTRREQERPGNALNDNTTHVPPARSSADLPKPNQTETRHTLTKDKVICVSACWFVPAQCGFSLSVPFAVETCWYIGKEEAVKFVNPLGDIAAESGRIPKGEFVRLAMQLLSVTVQRGNAEIFRRSGLVISREQGLRYDAGFAVPVLMS